MNNNEYKLAKLIDKNLGGAIVPEGLEDVANNSRYFSTGYDDDNPDRNVNLTASFTPEGWRAFQRERINESPFLRTLYNIFKPLI